MFFLLSKTISFLAKPITLVILALLLSVLLRRKKLKKIFFWIGFSLLIFFSNSMIANTVIGWWEARPVLIQDVEPHTVGVILGGMTDVEMEPRDRVYFNQSVDRILHAMKLYRMGKLKKLIVTGGSGSIYDQSVKEARLLEGFMLENGVRPQDIILETESRNTYENARFTARILEQHFPDQRILLITSATHVRRAKACFDKAGIESDVFPTTFYHDEFRPHMIYTPDVDALRKWSILFKETVGYLAYATIGYL